MPMLLASVPSSACWHEWHNWDPTVTQPGPNWESVGTIPSLRCCPPSLGSSGCACCQHQASTPPGGPCPRPCCQPVGRGQCGTHAMSFRYTKSSRAEQRVAPSPALVTFTGTPAEAGREDGKDQLVSGSPRNITPRALNRCDRYEL